jgi:hypothetical protein
MQTVTTVGLDIAKSVFQVHGIDAKGDVVIRRQLKRRYVLAFFQKLPSCLAPDLAVGDGALGFWKAIEEVSPSTRHQRCWVHKTANVLNKVALSVQVNMKADLLVLQ